MRIQFICKKNEIYGGFSAYVRRSSGLYNSTRFIVERLKADGIHHAEVIEVDDNNDIDRNVRRFMPDIVVIEALWVVPEKFNILQKLHPLVKWCVHLHSDMPFLAMEGIAMDWIIRYEEDCAVTIIANSKECFKALLPVVDPQFLEWLPNFYEGKPRKPDFKCEINSPTIRIGCFGAVRPLKNQLLQALAAIKFAHDIGKHLKFYVNATRVETMGDPVLKNLRQLFALQDNAELVESDWKEPEDFIDFLDTNIDIGMQVSLTETFNVVTADYVTAGIPIVVSDEVKWVSCWSQAEANNIDDIVKKMHTAYRGKLLVEWNQHLLMKNAEVAADLWNQFVRRGL
jgi:hypothetical protein